MSDVTAWMLRGACVDVDPELFFPVDEHPARKGVAEAKAICAGCSVATECLEYALGGPDYGIAGGLTGPERKRLRKTRRGACRNVARGRISAARAAGESWEAIARRLNWEGVPTVSFGRRWYGSTVRHVVGQGSTRQAPQFNVRRFLATVDQRFRELNPEAVAGGSRLRGCRL